MNKKPTEYPNGRIRSTFDFDALELQMLNELGNKMGLSKNKYIRQLIKKEHKEMKLFNYPKWGDDEQ